MLASRVGDQVLGGAADSLSLNGHRAPTLGAIAGSLGCCAPSVD